MSERDNDFINRLLLTFKVEAREHVNAMVSNLLELEKASTPEKQKEVIEVLFREAHSLKGAARAVNLDEIERTCQEMEGVFAALKRKELTPSSELLDVLHQVVDSLGVLLRSTQVEQATSRKTPIRELLRRLGRTSKGPPLPSKQATKETEVEPVDREPQTLEWNNTFVKSMEGQLSLLTRTAEQDHRLLAGMVDDLLNDMKRVLMLPFSSVLEIFPKLVRDLSRNQAKQVELLMQGGEIEVDRR